MGCGGELPELQRARLKVKAMRAFVRDLDVALAQAESALERDRDRPCQCNCNPQPIGGIGNDQNRKPHLTAA